MGLWEEKKRREMHVLKKKKEDSNLVLMNTVWPHRGLISQI